MASHESRPRSAQVAGLGRPPNGDDSALADHFLREIRALDIAAISEDEFVQTMDSLLQRLLTPSTHDQLLLSQDLHRQSDFGAQTANFGGKMARQTPRVPSAQRRSNGNGSLSSRWKSALDSNFSLPNQTFSQTTPATAAERKPTRAFRDGAREWGGPLQSSVSSFDSDHFESSFDEGRLSGDRLFQRNSTTNIADKSLASLQQSIGSINVSATGASQRRQPKVSGHHHHHEMILPSSAGALDDCWRRFTALRSRTTYPEEAPAIVHASLGETHPAAAEGEGERDGRDPLDRNLTTLDLSGGRDLARMHEWE